MKAHNETKGKKAAKTVLTRESLSRRLDELLGMAAWLQTDLVRKGGHRHAQELGAIMDRMEDLSRRMEEGPEGDRISERMERVSRSLGELEALFSRLTQERGIPPSEAVASLSASVRALEGVLL